MTYPAKRKPPSGFKAGDVLVCKACFQPTARTSVAQLYCRACSAKVQRERQAAWSRTHKTPRKREAVVRKNDILNTAADARCAGPIEISDGLHAMPETMAWTVSVRLPFCWNLSKNAIYRTGAGGHVYLREQVKSARARIVHDIQAAIAHVKPVEAKVYVSIFVQKPSHKGDAINVVDTVCDAIKVAIGIDDRWFAIRSLDWSVSRTNPGLVVTLSQAATEHHRVCSQCGYIKPLESNFNRAKGALLGRARVCFLCSRMPVAP